MAIGIRIFYTHRERAVIKLPSAPCIPKRGDLADHDIPKTKVRQPLVACSALQLTSNCRCQGPVSTKTIWCRSIGGQHSAQRCWSDDTGLHDPGPVPDNIINFYLCIIITTFLALMASNATERYVLYCYYTAVQAHLVTTGLFQPYFGQTCSISKIVYMPESLVELLG